MRLIPYVPALLAAALGCQATPPPDTSASAKQAIDPRPTLTLHAVTVVASGPVAVETGRWHWAYPTGAKLPPGTPAVDSGKYIVRWAQQNERWLMVDDVWNSDLPLPTAAPTPPRAPGRQ